MIFSFLTACAMRSPSLGGGRPGEGAPQGVSSSLRNQKADRISDNERSSQTRRRDKLLVCEGVGL